MRAVNDLAYAYGWAKDYILDNVYFDELHYLRLLFKQKKADEYRMLLLVFHTKDREAMLRELDVQAGITAVQVEADPGAFDKLKFALSNNPHFVVK